MRSPRSIEVPHHAWRASLPLVVTRMSEVFGAEAVKVHSDYHLQVSVDGRKHDVWVTVDGVVKYRLHGGRTIFARSHHAMADAIMAAKNHKTEMEKANKTLELARLVRQAQRELPLRLQEAVFCDAGYQRSGKAMAAAVYVCRMNGDVEAIAKSTPLVGIKSVEDAEYEALIVGAWLVRQFADSARCVIYTDSQHAAHRAQREPGVGEQVQWAAAW